MPAALGEVHHDKVVHCAVRRPASARSLGVMFLAHVALKIFVFTVPGVVRYFASLGLPAIVAYGTIALELLGGIALILGIYVSWVALPLAIEMLGTIVLVHGANGWLFTIGVARFTRFKVGGE